MGTMVDTIPDAVIAEPESDVQPSATQASDDAVATKLEEEITTLWGTHVRLSADRKATAKELRQIRSALAERLHEMKTLLSRPGRGGEWRGWLRERGIPRSSADRLVARYTETLSADDENVSSEAISKPTEADIIRSLYKVVWPSIRKTLTTPPLIFMFLSGIAGGLGVRYEWREEGLMLFRPETAAAATTHATAKANPGAGDGNSGSCATAQERG